MENILKLITVSELCNYSFFVPSYQRGYRWTELEVEDLLNDIYDFKPKEIPNSDEKTWYCLQPLVIKRKEDNCSFELIDGQQRLTTLYLILYYLNLDFIEEKRDKLFNLDYQTRENSKEFLKKPDSYSEENIDFYYISTAYQTIKNWFDYKEKSPNFDKNEYRSKIKFYTKFIWYEISKEEPIPVFSRLNIGKISLTNSELIKALFLNSSNYGRENSEKIKHRQFEIAAEWDNIEAGLQNDRFWYFLSNKNIRDNRIELIFDLIAGKKDNKDIYSTFRYFYKEMNEKSLSNINRNWKKIKDYYQRFLEWFQKREWYHKIGFVLHENIESISNLYDNSLKMTKSQFSEYLDKLIKQYFSKVKLLDLQYSDTKTKSVLLLYNIVTMLNNDKEHSYFPFDTFKLEKWDIEHIASLKDNNSIPKKEERKQWLEDVQVYFEECEKTKKLRKRITKIDITKDLDFENLFKDITDYFNEFMLDKTTGQMDDPNSISNLTLLDSFTNRSYKNAVFPLKRKRIIERDKNGYFVPICTKNTFLKYFSDYPPKISFWTIEDRQKYEQDLIKVLESYMEVE